MQMKMLVKLESHAQYPTARGPAYHFVSTVTDGEVESGARWRVISAELFRKDKQQVCGDVEKKRMLASRARCTTQKFYVAYGCCWCCTYAHELEFLVETYVPLSQRTSYPAPRKIPRRMCTPLIRICCSCTDSRG